MWSFLVLFFIVTSCYTLLHISLAESKKILFTAVVLPPLCCLLLYHFSAQQTNQTINWILTESGMVSAVAIFQVFEAIGFIFLTVLQIKAHFGLNLHFLTKWITAIPSPFFLISLFFLQTYLFLSVESVDFFIMALGFFVAITVLLLTITLLIRKVVKDWAVRAEMKVFAMLFQLLLAMFLPLMVKGVNVPFTQLQPELFPMIFTGLIILLLTAAGYLLYLKKNKKNYG